MAAPTPAAKNFLIPFLGDTDNKLLLKAAGFLAEGLGMYGIEVVTDTQAHTGSFSVFHALSDSVIAAATFSPAATGNNIAGQTIKAGDRICAPISSLTLTSGSGILYKAANSF